MSDESRKLLHERGLRVTVPRLAVLNILAQTKRPLSHTEVLECLGETKWDAATVYRNLVRLRDAGIAPVVSRANGIDRYALVKAEDSGHHHPHFLCEDCGHIACLPEALTASISMGGRWATSVQNAVVQFRGECPDCITNTQA